MGQVPVRTYGLIGDGRVATHMKQYFKLLSLPHLQWARKSQSKIELEEFVTKSDLILLLIKDDAIEKFIEEHPFLRSKNIVHFSGSLVIKNCPGVHPLMTFGMELYDLPTYLKIPFVTEKNEISFSKLFPELTNPSYQITVNDKVLYHTHCVMAGNFSMLLWQKLFQDFEKKLALPRDAAFLYLEQVTKNLKSNSEFNLTGPLARNDQDVLRKHLAVLEGDAYQDIYRAFIKAYQSESKT